MSRSLSITVLAACASAATNATGSASARGELVARELASASAPSTEHALDHGARYTVVRVTLDEQPTARSGSDVLESSTFCP